MYVGFKNSGGIWVVLRSFSMLRMVPASEIIRQRPALLALVMMINRFISSRSNHILYVRSETRFPIPRFVITLEAKLATSARCM